ncbi:MAG: flagellar basal-body MS-ring/collar protein FliF [Rhodothermales bacterium]
MQSFIYNMRQLIERLSLGQRVAMGLLLVGALGLLLGISYWVGRPDYALLFGGLEPTDASSVVESLNDQGVQYQLKENGTAVYVPREQVYELRLRFAGEGVVSSGPTGYELFDQGTLGMTDFMQKLNMKRALEGELARTVASVRQVDAARVHLVVPERSPFRDTQTRPSASVVLQLNSGGQLTPPQIEGISALVAGAVEGLAVSDVTVLDTRGNMLSNPDAGNPDLLASSNQLRMQQAIEIRLTEKGQTMLDEVLGPNNAIVRVTAMLDFTRVVTESESIDPESATVIAEERLEEGDETGGASANSMVRNYEISTSRERSEKNLGEISNLSISVILNYKRVVTPLPDGEDAEEEVTFEPYSNDEVTNIEAIVKNAVGFQPDRGDRFAIHQTHFDSSGENEIAAELRKQRRQEQLQMYIRYGLMVLALGIAMLLIRSATKRISVVTGLPDIAHVGGGHAAGHAAGHLEDASRGHLREGSDARGLLSSSDDDDEVDLELIDDIYSSKLSAEARARLKAKHLMFDEIRKQVVGRPEDTADLIRSWLAQDAQKNG